MNRKTVAKKTPARKTDESAAARQRLANAVSEIMSNPETPVGLFNAVGEETTEWTQAMLEQLDSSPDHIAACLDAYYKREEKRAAGGAR